MSAAAVAPQEVAEVAQTTVETAAVQPEQALESAGAAAATLVEDPSQQVMYLNDTTGQPLEAGQVQYVDENGNPVDMSQQVQYVDENGNPITFVDEFGNPVDPSTVDQQQLQMAQQPSQPAVYNISPELFQKLAQGLPLTEEEMAAITGAQPTASVPEVAAPTPAEDATGSKKKKSSKKKALSSKKAAKKGCC